LTDLVVATADVDESAQRFSRFLGRPASKNHWGRKVQLDRGCVQLVAPAMLNEIAGGIDVPSLPFIGLYAVAVKSLGILEDHLQRGGAEFLRRSESIVTRFPDELGAGSWLFVEQPTALPWRR
jgi:hypothetical protein